MNLNKQYEFIKMLNGLFNKGYKLNESLMMLFHIKPKLITKINLMLDNGQTLGECLQKLRFSKLVYDTVKLGETTNRLNEVINLIEKYLAFHLQMKGQVNKVLMYPIMLIFMAIISIEFIRLKLYPLINTLLTEFNVRQNQLALFISFNLLKIIGVCLLFLSLLITIYKKLPNLLLIVKNYRSLYIAHNLIILLACGNSLEQSLENLSHNLNKQVYDLKTLQTSLFDYNYTPSITSAFSPIFIYFFKLGVNANNLNQSLMDYTSIYLEYIKNQLTKIVYYIQFLIFTTLAVNIMLIYYVVMIPMFSITQKI